MTHSRVELSRGPLEYEVRGTGTPVVFLHPFLTDSRHFQAVRELLGDTIHSIAPTLPLGAHRLALHPDADNSVLGVAEHIAELLEALDLRDVILVGNDSGGGLAQIVATRFPDRVAGLVLCNCDCYEVFPPKMFGYLKYLARFPVLYRITARVLGAARFLRFSPMAFGWLSRRGLSDDLVRSYIEPLKRREIARDTCKLALSLDPELTQRAARDLAQSPKPLRLLWGLDDPFFPVRLAERLVKEVPGAQLRTVAHARAFVPVDAPAEFADLIQSMVQEREAVREIPGSARAAI